MCAMAMQLQREEDESLETSTEEGRFGPQPISRLEVCDQWGT